MQRISSQAFNIADTKKQTPAMSMLQLTETRWMLHGALPSTVCCLQMIMSLLMDKGDTVLCEEYTYPHMIESLVNPRGYKVLGIATDGDGIIPEALQQTLEQSSKGARPPRLLYTVPVGQNPTGSAVASYEGNSSQDVTVCTA